MKSIIGIGLIAIVLLGALLFYLSRSSQPPSRTVTSPSEEVSKDNPVSTANPSSVTSSQLPTSTAQNASIPLKGIREELKGPVLQLLFRQDLNTLTEANLLEYLKSQSISANEETQNIAANERRKVWTGVLPSSPGTKFEIKMRNLSGGEALQFESAALIISNTPEAFQESESMLRESFPSQPVEEKDYGNVKTWKFANGQRVWIEKEKSTSGDEEVLRIATEFGQD